MPSSSASLRWVYTAAVQDSRNGHPGGGDGHGFLRQVRGLSQRKSAVLLVVRHAGDECRDERGAAGRGGSSRTRIRGHGFKCCRSFGLPGGIHQRIIVLRIERYKQNPLVRFHAFQSIFLNVSGIGVMIAPAMRCNSLRNATLRTCESSTRLLHVIFLSLTCGGHLNFCNVN